MIRPIDNGGNGGPGTGLSTAQILEGFIAGGLVAGLSGFGAFNLLHEHFASSPLGNIGEAALAGAISVPIFLSAGGLAISSLMSEERVQARVSYLRDQGRLNSQAAFYTRNILVAAAATGLISQSFDNPMALVAAGLSGAALGIATKRFGRIRATA